MSSPLATPDFRRAPTYSFVTALVVVICALDSRALAEHVPYGQWLANLVMFAAFALVWRAAPARLRSIMLFGLLVGTAGEAVFSLCVGMYEYRGANIPLYIPPGHSLLYAAVYYVVREPFVLRHRERIGRAMLWSGALYAGVWLALAGDIYGALCTALFLLIVWRRPESRLFFGAMFVLVGYLEQVGTGFGCWSWPATLLNRAGWLPSGNPPSGISVFYFGFDVLCLELYAFSRPGLRARFVRLRERRRTARAQSAPQLVPAE